MENTLEMNLEEKLKNIQDKPGIYKMYSKDNDLLYIGKSIHLDKRVKSYFNKKINRSRKVQRMVKQIKDIDIQYTDTELDALLLECELIQKLQPPYNTLMTRHHRYKYFQFIQASQEQVKLKVTKKPTSKSRLTIGPLTNKKLMQQAYNYVATYYPYFISDKKQSYLGKPLQTQPKQAVEDFIQQSFLTPEMVDKVTVGMKHDADEWAYEKANEKLKCLQGLNYLKYMYNLLENLKESRYIGRLAMESGFKYYLINQGRLIKTIKTETTNEELVVNELKNYLQTCSKSKMTRIAQEDIHHILILERFRKYKIHRIEV